jgi:hypothetical protein
LRGFADLDALIGMVPSPVVTRFSAIDFGRGAEALDRDQLPGLLTELADRTRVLSITASSAIEGVPVAGADRAQRIIDRRTTTQPRAVPADPHHAWRPIGQVIVGRSATGLSADRPHSCRRRRRLDERSLKPVFACPLTAPRQLSISCDYFCSSFYQLGSFTVLFIQFCPTLSDRKTLTDRKLAPG